LLIPKPLAFSKTKLATGLDPVVATGSREENASKQKSIQTG
jgi:hypothetical protein